MPDFKNIINKELFSDIKKDSIVAWFAWRNVYEMIKSKKNSY